MEPTSITRPLIHFTPPSGWMNDPNGLVFFEGEWHLFYQYMPVGGSGGKHWGHAISSDLCHWEHMPIALFPDALGEIFSGSCVVDTRDTSGFFGGKAGLVAIFTNHLEQASGAVQVQSLAYSSDQGRSWTKYGGNPVLQGGGSDFRDPKVFWHEPSASWVMILASGDHADIYRSPDLKAWTLASTFGYGQTTLCWECPDLFSLRDEKGEEVWILSLSLLDRENFKDKVAPCITRYYSGTFDGHTFQADNHGARPLGHGPDDYAPVTFADAPDDRRILLGWLNHWGYAHYSGQMTLPRDLSWRDGTLRQSPSPEIDRAQTCQHVEIRNLEVDSSPITAPTTPWELTVPATAHSWTLEARKDDDLIFSVNQDLARGIWSVTRGVASFPPSWNEKKQDLRSAYTGPNEAAILSKVRETTRVITDASSVEAFFGGGQAYMAAQIFPPNGVWTITLRRS